MLTEQAFEHWAREIGYTEEAIAHLQEVRNSEPVRRVQGNAGNVSGFFSSQTMKLTLQVESRKVEFAALRVLHFHEEGVLEIYDQPRRLVINYLSKSGRKVVVSYTPDFLVIRQTGACYEEWKPAEKLPQLAEESPNRYVRQADGTWRCPPVEACLSDLGIGFRVRTSAELNPILVRNLSFLEDYYDAQYEAQHLSQEAQSSVRMIVTQNPGIKLTALFEVAKATRDEIYLMLAMRLVYFDPKASLLIEPENVALYADQDTAGLYARIKTFPTGLYHEGRSTFTLAPGTNVLWDGKLTEIILVGEQEVFLQNQDQGVIGVPHQTFEDMVRRGVVQGVAREVEADSRQDAYKILTGAGKAALEKAVTRVEILQQERTGTTAKSVTDRTLRRWKKNYRLSDAAYGMGLIGLIPQQKGNRTPRIPPKAYELMDRYAEGKYEQPEQKTKWAVWSLYQQESLRDGVYAVSYKTFTKYLNARPTHKQIERRQGSKAAYPHEPFYYSLDCDTPRHGDRVFEIGHIDHTQLDVEVICLRPFMNLGRPWASFLIDAYSRRLLAVVLLFDEPSRRTEMLLIRECVRRHGRIPRIIVVDGGSDLNSVYFDVLLACLESHKQVRPTHKARFGSVIERVFGISNTQLVHYLQGNTQIMKNVRQVTQSHNPQNRAIWTLPFLYAALTEWAYDHYDQTEHSALQQSPREAYELSLRETGFRKHKIIPYDETFRFLTLPSTPKGTAKLQPNKGVCINKRYFWSLSFRNAALEKTHLPVKYEPYDCGIAYAFINGVWTKCISEKFADFNGRTEREVALATIELENRSKQKGEKFKYKAGRLAEFLGSLDAKELLLKQRVQDAEMKQVFNLMAGATLSDLDVTTSLSALTIPAPTLPAITTDELTPIGSDSSDDSEFEIYEDYLV